MVGEERGEESDYEAAEHIDKEGLEGEFAEYMWGGYEL